MTAPATLRRTAELPAYALYGEAGDRDSVPALHIESIAARSRLYDWEIAAHVHHGLHQVLWLRSGSAQTVLDAARASAHGPVVLVIPPGVAHAFRFSRQADGHVLTLKAAALIERDADDAADALNRLFAAPRRFPLDDAPDEVARLQPLFEALHAEQSGADGAASPVPLWLARAIVWRLARLSRQAEPDASRKAAGDRALYTRWVVLLEAHYREHWPVSAYADRLGLSTDRLNRLLRTETGHTAQALLHDRLLREAARRLVHVAAPVSKLAFELGFDDPAYFYRFFKRGTGSSPRAFRARALAD